MEFVKEIGWSVAWFCIKSLVIPAVATVCMSRFVRWRRERIDREIRKDLVDHDQD